MTKRLYYTDPLLTAFDATVVSSDIDDGRSVVVLDQTAFYPTSGGQPFDTGQLNDVRVVDVVDQRGRDDRARRREEPAAGHGRARRYRLAAPLRSHAAAHWSARAVGRVRSAAPRPHGELSSRRGRARRSIWRARSVPRRSTAPSRWRIRSSGRIGRSGSDLRRPRKPAGCRFGRSQPVPGRFVLSKYRISISQPVAARTSRARA